VHFPQHGKCDSKGVKTQGQRKGQEFKHVPTLHYRSYRRA
jgi:hypothetical protein